MSSVGSVEAALAFVETHGVVLASAKGSAPRLTEAIVGGPIKGSWWAHPQSRLIFVIVSALADSDQILVCRLIDGKITLIHRRLWAALVRLAARFAPEQLAQVKEEHTASGNHVSHAIPFPRWVPRDVLQRARSLPAEEAVRLLAPWLLRSATRGPASRDGEPTVRPKRIRTKKGIAS